VWVWAFVVGLAGAALVGVLLAHRRTPPSAWSGVALAAAWTALTFTGGTLSHHAPAAQRATAAAYLGVAGAALLMLAAGLAAGRRALPRRGSFTAP
jgi:hypothetical protein